MAINIWLACLESEGTKIAYSRSETTRQRLAGSTTPPGWTPRGNTQGPPDRSEEDRDAVGRTSVLPRITTLEGGTERSGNLRHLATPDRDIILDNASAASRRVIFDSRQESSNESYDRTWRRWRGYCNHVGYPTDTCLTLLSDNERELFLRAFLNFYRTSNWNSDGRPTGTRREPVVASTLRQATSNLASAFRNNIGISPLHLPGTSNIRPIFRSWFQACENGDPPKRKQRAITPQLLRSMYKEAGGASTSRQCPTGLVIAEIAIVAYFYAMRSCEITSTTSPGRTKITRLRGVVFRDATHREIPHASSRVGGASRVTVTFENQKNGLKMDRRTQERTGDPVMCPVTQLASLIRRILKADPQAGPDTPVSTVWEGGTTRLVTSDELRRQLRSSCTRGGGAKTFGYGADDIGTRSIRSGAAMGLFLMNHPVAKIMILGRWSSDAFLDYIRPQVLEWTNQMSRDMINNNSFFDATDARRSDSADPLTRSRTVSFPTEPEEEQTI
ncbi:hypothetical protein MHU86_10857 [Fragilaria crotonensis]|nr:hypothetical protein MHU86_10857 [Fragilaria crotonensis]